MVTWIAIFVGGGLGSLARFGVGRALTHYVKSDFPWGTLGANVLSCVVMGIAVGFFGQKLDASPTWKMLLLIGFCGGFSTFSTFSFETLELFRSGNELLGVANVMISVVVCVGVLWVLTRN